MRFKSPFAKERERWHTCRAAGDKKRTILPYHHSRKQASPLIRSGSDRVNSHIMSWSSKGNLGKRVNVRGESGDDIAEVLRLVDVMLKFVVFLKLLWGLVGGGGP